MVNEVLRSIFKAHAGDATGGVATTSSQKHPEREDWATLFEQLAESLEELCSYEFVKRDAECDRTIRKMRHCEDTEELSFLVESLTSRITSILGLAHHSGVGRSRFSSDRFDPLKSELLDDTSDKFTSNKTASTGRIYVRS